MGYREGEQAYEDLLRQYVTDGSDSSDGLSQYDNNDKNINSTLPDVSEENEVLAANIRDSVTVPSKSVAFSKLQSINKDVKGWIYLPDTVIDYPVVQGKTNNTYLHKLFDGRKNFCGSIFADSGCRLFQDDNTILYGHHMRNGSMFAGILKYQKSSYYDKHPYGYLYTPDGNYVIAFFSGYTTKSTSDAYKMNIESKEDYQKWLDSCKKKSDFTSPVTPKADDQIITLSTCAYAFKDARYVLMGILIPAK